MREIIFRGKPVERFKNFIWVRKDLFDELGFVHGSLFVDKSGKTYICTSAMCTHTSCVNNGITTMIEVIPETVGQYTGLKDKNGKRIFEHDILVSPIGRKAIVSFGTYKPWSTKDGDDFESWKLLVMLNGHKNECGLGKHCAEYMQIIGNIHSNPELLE